LVALAVTSRERLGMLPDVPTVSESAVPGFEFSTWLGFVAPANSPAANLRTLANEIRHVSEDAGTRQKFAEQGITPRLLALKDFDSYIKQELDRLGPMVKSSGVKDK
ncbi:MAG TPA: tripartite tricarboxylate transporter substrate-binding protein, partial [Ramlibacter sp.]|nr:tripartite tricarboxylate transporter substrate-binding protein [Ramlibacter sp.]